jgi:hypothetical protein
MQVPSVTEAEKNFYENRALKFGGEVQLRPDGYNYLVLNRDGEVIFDTEAEDQRMLGAVYFNYDEEIEISATKDVEFIDGRYGIHIVPTQDGSHWVLQADDGEIFDLLEVEQKYKMDLEKEDDIEI